MARKNGWLIICFTAVLALSFTGCATTSPSPVFHSNITNCNFIVLGEVYYEGHARGGFQDLLDEARRQYPTADNVIHIMVERRVPRLGFLDLAFAARTVGMSGIAIQYIENGGFPLPPMALAVQYQAEQDDVERGNFFANLPVHFALGGIIGFSNTLDYRRYVWRDNRYELDFDGSSRMFNWFHPMFSMRFLFPVGGNGWSLGFGTDISAAFFGLFFPVNDLEYELWPFFTGGSLAPYLILGFNDIFLHAGFDFATGALYLSPNVWLGENLLLGFPVSLFGANRFGIVSLSDPPQRRVNPPQSFTEASYLQFGVSVQYVFGGRRHR